MDQTLQIGFARADISPPIGLPLSGFIVRENKPSTRIDAPIFVHVLALSYENELSLLVSYELLGISSNLETQVFEILNNELGERFSGDRCVLTATHNHSAPVVCALEGEAEPDAGYIQKLYSQTLTAARQAIASLADTTLHLASIRIPGLTYNRRAVLANGRVSMALAPEQAILERGPVDDTFTALVFRSPEGKNQAVIAHFACHGAAVCSQQVMGDIPGEVLRRMEAIFDAPCLYLQGCTGDINPLVAAADRQAMLAGVDQLETYLQSLPALLRPVTSLPLQSLSTDLDLYFDPPSDPGAIETKIQQLEKIIAGDVDSAEVQNTLTMLGDFMNFKPGERPDPVKAAFCATALVNAERRSLRALVTQRPLTPCPLRVVIWRLGQVGFAFVAAELFAMTGYKIRAAAQGMALLPVTYAGPVVGYLPDRLAMRKGGYEVSDAWRFYRQPAPFAPNSEERLVEHIQSLLELFK